MNGVLRYGCLLITEDQLIYNYANVVHGRNAPPEYFKRACLYLKQVHLEARTFSLTRFLKIMCANIMSLDNQCILQTSLTRLKI